MLWFEIPLFTNNHLSNTWDTDSNDKETNGKPLSIRISERVSLQDEKNKTLNRKKDLYLLG